MPMKIRIKPILLIITLGVYNSLLAKNPQTIELKRGLIIRSSIQIKKAIYLINAYDSLNRPLIRIEGNNITVDFNKSLLQGSTNKELPNEFYGLAILIKGNNITIKNARIRGYKVALMAEGCINLKIEHSDFSYNYRQELQSNWLSEDVSDWMSYHHNEHDEWLRYGAAIYLKACSRSIIQNNTITGGQCALMMMKCNDGLISDNDFSFNSGIGIGMYRSSRNRVIHNKLDYNVRGYSHGFYNRGQDSAGILLFEQCNENQFAFNSVTHGGDGFFLWAGQTTMDNGSGGCNGNYIYKNDFSYAPTNGVEVTFSKNIISDNIIKECDNGIWGGYSWETSISGNLFYKNKTGIAIEHGQHNAIMNNQFQENLQDGIKLWARKTQPLDWGYANKRDTKSHDYKILNNSFEKENTAINIVLTDNIVLDRNKYIDTKKELKTDSTVTHLNLPVKKLDDTTVVLHPFINAWNQKTIPLLSSPIGKNQIRITSWGPYDFRYPIIFLKKIDSNQVYYFDVLGPMGNWKIRKSKDISNISKNFGAFPATITAKKTGEDVQLILEYEGKKFISQFGKSQMAGKPYLFSYRDYQPDINWTVNWYSWDLAHDPNKNYPGFIDFINNSKSIKTETTKKLAYTWWGEIGKHLPADSFATIATSTISLEKGLYKIGVTADDLVKVYIDGKLVIDFWDAAKYVNDEDAHHSALIPLGGKHDIRVEQVENSGFATLIFTIKPM